MLLLKYDVRGILNKDIFPELIDYFLSLFLKKTKTKKILLSHDFNEKNLILKNYLLEKYQKIFKDLNALPSPIFYYYVIKERKPGIMLTASHLPFNYVGLKFVLPDGTNWKPNKLQTFLKKSKFSSSKFLKIKVNKNLIKNYFLHLKKFINQPKKFWVEFNLNNYFLKAVLPYFKLLKVFHKKNCPLFIDSDGDNDRLLFYYQKNQIPLDIIFYLLAQDKNYKNLGVPIYFSKFLEKKLIDQNKKIFYIETGHINFKKAYKKFNLDLAFEPSGHFYFFKELKTEGPYFALIKFLNLNLKFEEIKNILNSFKIKRFSLKLNKNLNLNNLIFSLQKKFSLRFKKFDGFCLYDKKKEVFIHLRKSATENKLRISIEAPVPKIFEKEIKNASTRNC